MRAHELAAELAAQIRTGTITPGSWMPSERQLAETYAVSRSTARGALAQLAEQGLVRPVPGSGVQVEAVDLVEPELHRTLTQIGVQLDDIRTRLARLESAAGTGEPTA